MPTTTETRQARDEHRVVESTGTTDTASTRARYAVNEVFYSPQGEGVRAGTLNVFVRFQSCNLRCDDAPGPLSPGTFKCDT